MFQLYWIALHLIIERISMVLLKSSEKRKKVFSSKAVKKLPDVFQVNTGLLAGQFTTTSGREKRSTLSCLLIFLAIIDGKFSMV